MELSVLSTMLGSTVALEDAFFELFVFSAMLGSTVALGDDYSSMAAACARRFCRLRCTPRCFLFGSQVHDPWHHGGMDRKDSCWYCWFSCTSRCVPLSSSTVVDTPVFAQWLIPMALTIEISQLQFDKVVFVPVVQVCSSIL